MSYQIVCDDVLTWAAGYEGEPFMACLCDPPYSLGDGKRGFMNKVWDTGIAFQPETWAAIADHLYPGAFLMAFGGSRTFHRLACAVEDAGLIVHPAIVHLQGQGFPKSTRIERSFANGNSPFCECENSQQQFPVRVPECNDPDEKNKDVNCQGDCPQDCRCRDGQPHQGEDSAQGVEPLQDDVQEHNRSCGPSAETQEDSEPSHTPCQVQCSDRQHIDTSQDGQVSSGDVSQLSLDHADETYHVDGSIYANKDGNEAQGVAPIHSVGDITADHNRHIHNSDNALQVGSLDIPFKETCAHNTTEQQFCQNCGKIKKGTWAGHRYGLQALKPCAEFILCAQKPYAGRPVDSIVATGAGALWIDGARVNANDGVPKFTHRQETSVNCYGDGKNGSNRTGEIDKTTGRWPPNVTLSHIPPHPCPACDGDGCQACGDGWLEGCRRVGTKRVRSGTAVRENIGVSSKGIYSPGHSDITKDPTDNITYADPDGTEQVDDWLCVEGCPVRALGEQSGESGNGVMRTGAKRKALKAWREMEGRDLSKSPPLSGPQKAPDVYGDTGTAARFYPQSSWEYEIEERLASVTPFYYCAKSARRERDSGLPDGERNTNPCVKPLSLLIWLARLLAPPPEYAPRRLLVPFAGSGSEICGALLSGGFDEIVGIELESEYVEIANARCRFWSGWSERGHDDPKVILKEAAKEKKKEPEPQMELL